jgi:hypothetical protein
MSLRYIHPAEKDLRSAVNSLSERPQVLDFPKTGSGRASE